MQPVPVCTAGPDKMYGQSTLVHTPLYCIVNIFGEYTVVHTTVYTSGESTAVHTAL